MNKIVDEKRKIDTAKICELLNGMSEQEKTKIYYMSKNSVDEYDVSSEDY